MILEKVNSPEDLKKLSRSELPQLCEELRAFLVQSVSQTGGHLASNLGAVELTVAIHRVFDTTKDRLVFDVGHQCYVHKALTGRRELFSTLRQLDGLSGFPKPYESVHDAFIAGHASNSVSVALGMARARTLRQEPYSVLALIGDGALTGGLAYEGLNNAGASGEPLIVILNDNGMSISPNVGAMPSHLSRLRSKPAYYHFKKWYRGLFGKRPMENRIYRFNHKLKSSLKKASGPAAPCLRIWALPIWGPLTAMICPGCATCWSGPGSWGAPCWSMSIPSRVRDIPSPSRIPTSSTASGPLIPRPDWFGAEGRRRFPPCSARL